MPSSDSKYCKQWITERGAECGQAFPLSKKTCDACFSRIASAYTALDPLLENRGADNTAAPSNHERQMPRNTEEISKTNPGPQALAEDPRPWGHRKKMNRDKRSLKLPHNIMSDQQITDKEPKVQYTHGPINHTIRRPANIKFLMATENQVCDS
ncbi:hypothetical protein BCON_0337g00090 [Botryotinia convoluta]|uniref:Uncharacterized protein n=1 Tax=Botryotinia convoluta TaxID=54673 RepID=A0A4Z1HCY7_9HELO|nr:hypothetical protein BCON_0337g00090 [Botryotinia convoluta]